MGRKYEDGCTGMGWGSMDWVDLAQDRDVAGTCKCGNAPSGSIK